MSCRDKLAHGRVSEIFENRSGKIEHLLVENGHGSIVVHVLGCSLPQ